MNDFYNLKIKINKEQSEQRLDKALTNCIKNMSRSQLKLLIENGNIKRNDAVVREPSYIVKEGEIYLVSILSIQSKKFKPENIDIKIVYEDKDLIVINKEAGMVTHPAPGNEDGTLVNALLHHSKNNLSNINDNSRPGIVHRLDKDTSGLMLVAKNNESHLKLSEQFKAHSITRKYEAIVWGYPKKQTIEGYIERNKKNRKKMSLNNKGNGKYSKTEINLKENFEIASLVECKLYTGRTHQVRLHMTSINSPLVGDKLYGKSKINQYGKAKSTFNKFLILKNFNRQALHASHIGFIHPTQKKIMQFDSKLPEDMGNLLDLLLKY